VALVDALGNLVRFLLLPGQAHDMKGVAPLVVSQKWWKFQGGVISG
jgi:transposase